MPPQRQGQSGDHDQQPQLGIDHEPHREHAERDQRAKVQRVLAGQHQRAGLDPRCQLEERHDRAGERDRADEHPDEDLGGVDTCQVLHLQGRGLGTVGFALDVQVAVPADQHRSQTHERVQQGDQLGHPGHLDHAGPPQPDRRTHQHRHHQHRQAGAGEVPVDRQCDRRHQRHSHAGNAERVAQLRRLVVGQPGEGQDEQQGGDDVRRLRGGLDGHQITHSLSAPSASGEHAEHPLGHREPTEDIDAGQQDCHERQCGDHGVVMADLEQGAGQDDPGDRVRHRHQRCV